MNIKRPIPIIGLLLIMTMASGTKAQVCYRLHKPKVVVVAPSPVVVVKPQLYRPHKTWVPGHWSRGRFGKPRWIRGHWVLR